MTVPTIPVIPAKMGEAGAHQEQLYAILSAIKANVEAHGELFRDSSTTDSGGDETDGLVKDVADLKTAVGDETGIVKILTIYRRSRGESGRKHGDRV